MDSKLNDQVVAMLTAAGFGKIKTVASAATVTISGEKDGVQAVFHASSAKQGVDANKGGGRYMDTPELEAAAVPTFKDLGGLSLDSPDLARAAGLTADKLEILRRMPARV